MSNVVPTHEQVRALAAAVRDGKCSPEQREYLANMLYLINTALQHAARQHPDKDALWRATYVGVAWEPVGTAYAELFAPAGQARPRMSETTDQEQCDPPDRPEVVELRRYDGDEPAGWAMVMPEGNVVAHIPDRTGADTGLASMYSSLDSAERLLAYADVYLCTSEMGAV